MGANASSLSAAASSGGRKRPYENAAAVTDQRPKRQAVAVDEKDVQQLEDDETNNDATPNGFGLLNKDLWFAVDLAHKPKLTCGATPLVARCMLEYGWSENKARRVLKAYRQFLELKVVKNDWNAEILSPPKYIEMMWREHCLDTTNYEPDCRLLCGHYVHHKPDGGLDEESRMKRVQATQEAFKERFDADDLDLDVWSFGQVNNTTSNCESANVKDPNEVILLVFVEGQEQSFYKVKRRACLQLMFDHFASRKGVETDSLSFMFRGERLEPGLTPLFYKLEDKDRIQVFSAVEIRP